MTHYWKSSVHTLGGVTPRKQQVVNFPFSMVDVVSKQRTDEKKGYYAQIQGQFFPWWLTLV